jgi:GAF domain
MSEQAAPPVAGPQRAGRRAVSERGPCGGLEVDRVRDRLAELEVEHRHLCDDYSTLEGRIAELGNLCVVMERLHGTLDHGEVLAGVQDVVINVIGSEELAVFEPSEDGLWLVPTQSFGVEGRRLGRVAWGEGPIGRAAVEGKGWVVGDGAAPPELPDLTACVPLPAGDQVAGVLVIWKMLAHKPVFGEADRSVLEHLTRHAATALLLTSSRRSGRRRVRALEASP